MKCGKHYGNHNGSLMKAPGELTPERLRRMLVALGIICAGLAFVAWSLCVAASQGEQDR